jgi:hypothetical protein
VGAAQAEVPLALRPSLRDGLPPVQAVVPGVVEALKGPLERHAAQKAAAPAGTHLVMSPLEFMQPSIERPVCGGQICWFCVCSGSKRLVGERQVSGIDPSTPAFRR